MDVEIMPKTRYVSNALLGFEFGRTPARRPALTVLDEKSCKGAYTRVLKCCKIQVH